MSWTAGRSTRFTPATRRAILARDVLCKACGIAPSTEADHVIPWAFGGSDEIDNGQGLCSPCHAAKTKSESKHRRTRRTPHAHPGMRA